MSGGRPVPTSPIKEQRGSRSQIEIAQAAGISQGFLSMLESGQKRLTPGVARRLAPALGTTTDQLLLGEHLAKLSRAATKCKIDPQRLLSEAEKLAEILPNGEVGDAIVEALAGIVRQALKPLT
jgi:transcriptional regulator with XRE-family HTH domain